MASFRRCSLRPSGWSKKIAFPFVNKPASEARPAQGQGHCELQWRWKFLVLVIGLCSSTGKSRKSGLSAKRSKSKPPKGQEGAGGSAARIPRSRRLVFALLLFVLLPLLLPGGVELGLRLAGYGYRTEFFKRIQVGTEDYLVENDKFGLGFFPPALARSPPPVVMKAKKPPGTYRIFLLGESAALGDPRPAYGAGRYLQTLLQERHPGVQFEVICAAMTAINSHALLPIARECAQHEGDLWIIYMGNNEMVGPFGAATIFGAQAPPRYFVRLGLALQKLRLGQWLAAQAGKLRRHTARPATWGGMEMFMESRVAPGDQKKEAVYGNFAGNLGDIVRAGEASGAKVILSTVAVNLKDCPPFASLPGEKLTPEQGAAYEKLYSKASNAQSEGNLAQAATLYEQAAKLETHMAENQFRQGECLLRLTNFAAASSHFQQACDDDALPFRADSRVNDAIARVAQDHDKRGVAFFDAVKLFATNSPALVPGEEWFYEHVHYNFAGNYRLARAWAEQVDGLLPPALRAGARTDWAIQEVCERRLGLTDWNRASVLEDVLRRMHQPPFAGQLNSTQRLASLQNSLGEIRKRMTTNAVVKARAVYEGALTQAPGDHRLHENFAEFLEAIGELQPAAVEWQRVRELTPHHHLGYFQQGRLLARLGQLSEAQSALRTAVTLRPDLSEGWFELGKLHFSEGKAALAWQEFKRCEDLIPGDYRAYYHAGQALSKLQRRIGKPATRWVRSWLSTARSNRRGRSLKKSSAWRQTIRWPT